MSDALRHREARNLERALETEDALRVAEARVQELENQLQVNANAWQIKADLLIAAEWRIQELEAALRDKNARISELAEYAKEEARRALEPRAER